MPKKPRIRINTKRKGNRNELKSKKLLESTGVYDVQLNLQQIRVINIALVNLNKKDRAAFPTHLRQKWVTMVKEIFEDWEERKKQPQVEGQNFNKLQAPSLTMNE